MPWMEQISTRGGLFATQYLEDPLIALSSRDLVLAWARKLLCTQRGVQDEYLAGT